jgi:hypothetical protein
MTDGNRNQMYSDYKEVRIKRSVVALIESKLIPGEDISDGLERLIDAYDGVQGCIRSLIQVMSVPARIKEVKSKKEKEEVNAA